MTGARREGSGGRPGPAHKNTQQTPGSDPLKILVLGAGVIGTTSAYFLARAGHEVIVIERRPGGAHGYHAKCFTGWNAEAALARQAAALLLIIVLMALTLLSLPITNRL